MGYARCSVLLLAGLLVSLAVVRWDTHNPPARLSPALYGEVRDARGPLAGATVRLQGTTRSTTTTARGTFRLTGSIPANSRVTAWKAGYFIGGAAAQNSPLTIQLKPLPSSDCEEYRWLSPHPDAAKPDNCGNCHQEIYREWASSGHARSVSSRHFQNLYDGSTWRGRQNIGWNLLAEHPDGAGVCTSCHAPSAGFDNPAYYDLRKATGTARDGVHCDYCHKVTNVGNVEFGLTHGRFGLTLLRPEDGRLTLGPLDDVDRGEDAYAPIYRDSRYCATCHEGIVFGVHVYSTYSEWLESPARRQGKQCQTCHMAAAGAMSNFAPGHGGILRDPQTLGNHRLFTGDRLAMLRKCLKVDIHGQIQKGVTSVDVSVTPEDVGHLVPTGFADRNIILVVEGFSNKGRSLPALGKTPRLPASAGKAFQGLPGVIYAKQLSDFDGQAPVPFWRAKPTLVDTRLSPGKAARSSYQFSGSAKHVHVRLLYRRFWADVAEAKEWPDNELIVLDKDFPLPSRE